MRESLESTVLMFHLRSTVNASTKTLNTTPPAVEFCYDRSHRQPILVKNTTEDREGNKCRNEGHLSENA